MVDLQAGEYTEKKLTPEEVRQFYAELKGAVLVGICSSHAASAGVTARRVCRKTKDARCAGGGVRRDATF
jgi:hypothetical protein